MENLVKTITTTDADDFERECSEFLSRGYVLFTAQTGIVQSEKQDYPDFWHAIFVKKEYANSFSANSGRIGIGR